MAINFPNTPSLNETYTVGSTTWLYDGEKWVLASTPISIDDLSDVDLTTVSPSAGDVLSYDGTNWVSASATTGVTSLSALTDVDLVNLQDGQIIKYSSASASWYNEYEAIQNVDGGAANAVYGGIIALSGGGASG